MDKDGLPKTIHFSYDDIILKLPLRSVHKVSVYFAVAYDLCRRHACRVKNFRIRCETTSGNGMLDDWRLIERNLN